MGCRLMAFSSSSRRLSENLREFLSTARFEPDQPPGRNLEWPRITVVTPSFNQAPYLERTIISIHNQGYPNLEHIVIDGGSTDGSVDILQRYSRRFAYWHSEPDDGQCDAINTGAAQASGTFMTWINSDDLLLPGALNRIGALIRQHAEIDLFYGNQVEADQYDRVTKRVYTIDFDLRDFLYEIHIIIHQQSAFWRTDIFREMGGLNNCAYAMDYDLFYRMISSGITWMRIEDFLAVFRMYPDSLTGTGEVGRSRSPTVDQIFEEAIGRPRSVWDQTVMKAFYKTKRFMIEPKSLVAAAEHRIGKLMTQPKKNR